MVGQLGDLICRGLPQILDGERDLRVVDVGLDHAALQDAVAAGEAQVVVLDEDGAAAPGVPGRLCAARADVGLAVLAYRPTRAYAARIHTFGVSVCIATEAPAAEIVRGVRLAAEGGQAFVAMSPRPPRTKRAVGIGSLTRRERAVLELLGKGQTNAEIAQALCISVGTTRIHVKHVYRKLGVHSRGELLGVER